MAPWLAATWSDFIERLRAWVRAEAGPGRLLPWVPVAFGAGIALYFAAEHEPIAWVAALAAASFGAVAFLLRRQRIFPLAVLIAAMAAGFAVVSAKASRVSHAVLAKPIYAVSLKGFVETREERERSDRFELRVAEMDSARDRIKLQRVRLSVKKGTAPAVGSFVELKAQLQPPLSPLRPGGYDSAATCIFRASPRRALRWARSSGCRRLPIAAGRCAMRRRCRRCVMPSMRGSDCRSVAISVRSPPRC